MHIPDGYLSVEVCAVTAAVSAAATGYSIHRMRDSLADRTVPLTGMMASLVFAGQMVNFPVGTGVSGHLMGGVLAATVLGPWAGAVAISLVLVTQWALFSDGGLTALGANILHMAVIGSIGGYAIMATVRKWFGQTPRGTIIGAVVAAWFSVMAAAALFCLEFRLSHHTADFNFRNLFTLMVSVHALIAIGEAIITGLVLGVIVRQRPDLLYSPLPATTHSAGLVRFLVAGVTLALAVGAFLAPFASSLPDGLDSVASRLSFPEAPSVVPGAFPDYSEIPLRSWQTLSVSIAGIGGTIVVFVAAVLLGRLLPGRRTVVPQD